MSQLRFELQNALSALVGARSDADRTASADRLIAAVGAYVASPEVLDEAPDTAAPAELLRSLLPAEPPLSAFSDEELAQFNALLPWAAMSVDTRGRLLGRPWSAAKRGSVTPLADRRHAAFAARYPLEGRHVAEFGCFEGLHTLALRLLGARVTAVDGRPDNVLKTLARVWAYGEHCDAVLWNVETPPPPALPPAWDVLHHIGVLYHLTDPVGHLATVLPRTRGAVLLDTHVAESADLAAKRYDSVGRAWRYQRVKEPYAANAPFAGMLDHAKWLVLEDLTGLLGEHGFAEVQVVEDRLERKGRRVTVWAFREPA